MAKRKATTQIPEGSTKRAKTNPKPTPTATPKIKYKLRTGAKSTNASPEGLVNLTPRTTRKSATTTASVPATGITPPPTTITTDQKGIVSDAPPAPETGVQPDKGASADTAIEPVTPNKVQSSRQPRQSTASSITNNALATATTKVTKSRSNKTAKASEPSAINAQSIERDINPEEIDDAINTALARGLQASAAKSAIEARNTGISQQKIAERNARQEQVHIAKQAELAKKAELAQLEEIAKQAELVKQGELATLATTTTTSDTTDENAFVKSINEEASNVSLLALPQQIREKFYYCLLQGNDDFTAEEQEELRTKILADLEGIAFANTTQGLTKPKSRLDFLLTCRQIYNEAQPIALATIPFMVCAQRDPIKVEHSKKRKLAKANKSEQTVYEENERAVQPRSDLFLQQRFSKLAKKVKYVKHLAHSIPSTGHHGVTYNEDLDWNPFGVNIALVEGLNLETLTLWSNGFPIGHFDTIIKSSITETLASWIMHSTIDAASLRRINIIIKDPTYAKETILDMAVLRVEMNTALKEMAARAWMVKNRETNELRFEVVDLNGKIIRVKEGERVVQVLIASYDEVVSENIELLA